MDNSIFDHTVYNPIQGCNATVYEHSVKYERMPDGSVVRVYRDDNGQIRIVAFKSPEHNVGYSGMLLDCYGVIRWKATAPAMRGKGTTEQLRAYLAIVMKINVKRSDMQTIAGRACYGEA